MSRLEEIEAYFSSSVNRAREPERQGEYEDWLIQRVRRLETALTEMHNKLDRLGDFNSGILGDYAEQLRLSLKEP